MPTQTLISKFKAKDVDKIIRSLERARNATQRSIDQFNDYRPLGNIKALKSDVEFRKQTGINELKKQVKLLDKFSSKLLDYKIKTPQEETLHAIRTGKLPKARR